MLKDLGAFYACSEAIQSVNPLVSCIFVVLYFRPIQLVVSSNINLSSRLFQQPRVYFGKKSLAEGYISSEVLSQGYIFLTKTPKNW